ncbi:MAG: FG-GAP repeat domain-containing protein, partial [Armatimonadota bacterium]
GSGTYATLSNGVGVATAILRVTSPGTARVFARHTDDCSHETVSWVAVAYADQPWYATGIQRSHPLVVDLDDGADGKKEVVVVTNTGTLVAVDSGGHELWSRGKFGSGNTTASCAPMDGVRSGRPCIFVPAENQQAAYAYSYDGRPLAGWPARSRFAFMDVACAIGDINLDGSAEIVGGDQSCYVFSWSPTGHWTGAGDGGASCLWVNLTGTANTVIHSSTCALGDLDGDPKGILDVVVGTLSSPGNVFAFPGDAWGDYAAAGLYLNNWPILGGDRVETSPAIGDIDGDGKNDVAWGAEDGNVHIWLSSTNSQKLCATGGPIASSPALADLDGDGKLDVIAGSDSGSVWAFNWLGQSVRGWAGGIKLNTSGNYPIEAPVSVGDVTGDGQLNVVAVCSDGFVYALYADGADHEIDNKRTGSVAWAGCCVSSSDSSVQMYNAPVIDDVNNDGRVDVLVAGSKGIYMFHPDAPYVNDPSHYPWPTFHRDNARSGCATPVPAPVNASVQGIVSFNGTPVQSAKIYIYKNDGSPVYIPHSNPPVERGYVLSVGDVDPTAVGFGAYCISQLEPNETYKIKIEATGHVTQWIENIAVTTGLTRVDVAL